MFIIIDKSLAFDKLELLVFCYGIAKSLDENKGYYTFNTESLLEDMNMKNNERNRKNIEDVIWNLDRKCKIFPYEYADESYCICHIGYEPNIFYFKLYKYEFDLLKDKSKSLSENAKLLHYYCYILSRLDLITQTFSMSNSFIRTGYDITDKTIKKYNDRLIELKLISVNTECKDGINTSNFYKRLYVEEMVVKEPSYIDTIATDSIENKPIVYVNVDADAPIESINRYLAKQGIFYLCIDDLNIPYCNDYFDVSTGWSRIEEFLLKYREKFNGVTSAKAIKELNKSNVLKED